jgi:hypothetical protein
MNPLKIEVTEAMLAAHSFGAHEPDWTLIDGIKAVLHHPDTLRQIREQVMLPITEHEWTALQVAEGLQELSGDIDFDDPDELAETCGHALNALHHVRGLVNRTRASLGRLLGEET